MVGQYSIRIEEAYVGWYLRFVRFHGLRHQEVMGASELEAFLTDMAKRGVSVSTQNQALNVIVLLDQEVLGIESGDLATMLARRTRRGPVVLRPGAVRGGAGGDEIGVSDAVTACRRAAFGTSCRMARPASLFRINKTELQWCSVAYRRWESPV